MGDTLPLISGEVYYDVFMQGQLVWNFADGFLETMADVNAVFCAVARTEAGATGQFASGTPMGMAAGTYTRITRLRAGNGGDETFAVDGDGVPIDLPVYIETVDENGDVASGGGAGDSQAIQQILKVVQAQQRR
jgi:hypothetical protein